MACPQQKGLTVAFKRNKYNAVKCRYVSDSGLDHTYDSRKEVEYAMELDLRVRVGEIKSWRPQVNIPLHVSGRKVCTYRLDFEVTHNDDTIELVEVKGFATPLWRLKWKIFEAEYEVEHPEVKRLLVRV